MSWLDNEPPEDRSLAKAYWCNMNVFLAHTSTGDWPDCRCPEGLPSAPGTLGREDTA